MDSRTAGRGDFLNVLHALLEDIQFSNTAKDLARDKHTIASRYASEGLSFFTKTLPLLARKFDLALKTGRFECPTNFRRYKKTALPVFLRGLLSKVFDADGRIREDADKVAIAEIRQLLYTFYKLVQEFSTSQQLLAECKFRQIDAGLPALEQVESPVTRRVLGLAKEFLRDLFHGFDPYDIVPSHGPGIVSSGEKPHEKRIFLTKYRMIHEQYPYYRFFYVNSLHLLHTIPNYWSRHVQESGINKVLFVPKDSRGPRTIACEPLEYQFVQQGLRKRIYDYVESHPLTRGRVNFTDQTINQRLAYEGSIHDCSIATVDLRDASDSVSNDLVKYLFQDTSLDKPLQALRTPRSLLPSGEVIELRKYAAMGSALCFPIEALVFYSLLIGCQSFFEDLDPFGTVYGDDIILRGEMYNFFAEVLHDVGLKVNDEKSCVTGSFKESCGAEYFAGHDVSYVKCRTLDASSPDGLASVVAQSNLMFERGYYRTAKLLEDLARASCPQIAYGLSNSGYLCFSSSRWPKMRPKGRLRWNRSLQRLEHRVPTIVGVNYTVNEDSTAEEFAEYFRKITTGWSDEFRSGCYAKRSVKMKWKYVHVDE